MSKFQETIVTFVRLCNMKFIILGLHILNLEERHGQYFRGCTLLAHCINCVTSKLNYIQKPVCSVIVYYITYVLCVLLCDGGLLLFDAWYVHLEGRVGLLWASTSVGSELGSSRPITQ